MEKYAQVADVVRGVFKEYDPNFAPMSLDEAYLDITHMLDSQDSQVTAWSVVQEMRGKICDRTGLTASAGIAPNCLLAKVCSDLNKPDGQYQLQHNSQEILQFVSSLSIRKVGGIGNVTEQLLKAVGVQTCQDLYIKRAEIRLLFSELSSDFYLAVSQGIGSTRIEPPEERERKSISTETTFRATSDRGQLLETLAELCADLAKDCKDKAITGQAVTVKIKSHDFKLKTKVSQMCQFSNCEELIHVTAKKILTNLLDSSDEQPLSLRLMGVRLSELKDKNDHSLKQRQGNLLAFVRGEGSSTQASTCKANTKKYQCPMCGFEVESLNILNNHVDKCLTVNDIDDQTDASITSTEEKCPICDYKANNLTDLNNHIDECISNTNNKLETKNVKSDHIIVPTKIQASLNKAEPESDEDMSSDNIPESDEDMFAECDPTEYINPKYESLKVETEKLTDVLRESVSESFFKHKSLECKSPEKQKVNHLSPILNPPSPVEDSPFTCPICFTSENFKSEEVLSRHVEECLSKQEIANILQTDKTSHRLPVAGGNKIATATSKKRKSEEIDGRTEKRNKSSSKIDSYFKSTS
eukprot:GFUD01027415.1.p1 GENE.GFUD01027415.1~~GFUD01027415.1.p1  ORF type:complete len:669 (+),score=212.14 GFUD01027415.1:257-2008(+)